MYSTSELAIRAKQLANLTYGEMEHLFAFTLRFFLFLATLSYLRVTLS
jgi:hypothetical protein